MLLIFHLDKSKKIAKEKRPQLVVFIDNKQVSSQTDDLKRMYC
jgi:hypothetical protein